MKYLRLLLLFCIARESRKIYSISLFFRRLLTETQKQTFHLHQIAAKSSKYIEKHFSQVFKLNPLTNLHTRLSVKRVVG